MDNSPYPYPHYVGMLGFLIFIFAATAVFVAVLPLDRKLKSFPIIGVIAVVLTIASAIISFGIFGMSIVGAFSAGTTS